MATNKKTETAKAAETTLINIPYIEGEAPDLTVGINGKLYKIQKGKPVEVPIAVAKVIWNSWDQEAALRAYSESVKMQEIEG